jgi:hypothetical protein
MNTILANRQQHPLFLSMLRDVRVPWVAHLANRFLSAGGMCYFMEEEGVKTRMYIYNYFAFLNGGPFRAKWQLRAYSGDGKRTMVQKGEISQSETITVEMEPFARKLGPLGLCMIHLIPAEKSFITRNSFMTHFFIEYYTSQAESVMHSLGHPVPKVHKVNDYITTSFQAGGDAYILVSNSCYRRFHYPAKLFKNGFRISLRNSKGESRHYEMKPLLPLATEKVNLRKIWPDLDAFTLGKPVVIQICGPNVLYSPLVIQSKPHGYIAMDHFQGGEWHDVESPAAAC